MQRALWLAALASILAWSTAVSAAPAITASAPQATRQDSPAPVEVGAGPLSEPALGFVGRNEYRANSAAFVGYFTTVTGLDRALVFTDPDAPSASSARFTYVAEVNFSPPLGDTGLTAATGTGTLTIYFDEAAGAGFDDPASFADGMPIAIADVRVLDTLYLESAEGGVVVGDEELTQTAAVLFSLAGEQYRFGHVGVRQRMRFTGAATRSDQALLADVAGSTVVTYREPNPPRDEPPASPPAGQGTPASADDCASVEPWLEEAGTRLERVAAIVAEIPEDATVASLDAESLREQADEVAALMAEQRETEVPAAGIPANRLLVTALSTYGRALTLLASAVADGNEASFAQGRAILEDGQDLAGRAGDQLEQVATACGVAR